MITNPESDGGIDAEPDAEAPKRPEKSGRRPKPRIQVVEVEAGTNGDSLPVVAKDRATLVPAIASLADALADANDIPSLQAIHAQAAVLEEATKQFRVAFEEVVKLAIVRLQAERRIGAELAQTVHRGGHGSKYHNGSSIKGGSSARLPDDISPNMSSRYQRLARIPEEVFLSYLANAEEKKRVPSANALNNYNAKLRRRPGSAGMQKRRKVRAVSTLPVAVLEALCAFMSIDVCVGNPGISIPSAMQVNPDTVQTKDLRGVVFVAECPDQAEWLPKLANCRTKARVEEVAVVLLGSPFEIWFKQVELSGWTCGFVQGTSQGLMLAYHGPRAHGFMVSLAAHATVLSARSLREQ